MDLMCTGGVPLPSGIAISYYCDSVAIDARNILRRGQSPKIYLAQRFDQILPLILCQASIILIFDLTIKLHAVVGKPTCIDNIVQVYAVIEFGYGDI